MLHNSYDSKFKKITKQLIFWLSLGAMLALFIFLLKNEIKPKQHHINLEIDIKNKVNICTPENPKDLFKRKLYEF